MELRYQERLRHTSNSMMKWRKAILFYGIVPGGRRPSTCSSWHLDVLSFAPARRHQLRQPSLSLGHPRIGTGSPPRDSTRGHSLQGAHGTLGAGPGLPMRAPWLSSSWWPSCLRVRPLGGVGWRVASSCDTQRLISRIRLLPAALLLTVDGRIRPPHALSRCSAHRVPSSAADRLTPSSP